MGGKFYKFPLIVWLTPKGKKGKWKLTRKNLVKEMTSVGIKGSREEKKKGVHHVKPREKAPGGFMVECNNVVCHINVHEALLRHPHVVSGKMRVSMEPAAVSHEAVLEGVPRDIGLGLIKNATKAWKVNRSPGGLVFCKFRSLSELNAAIGDGKLALPGTFATCDVREAWKKMSLCDGGCYGWVVGGWEASARHARAPVNRGKECATIVEEKGTRRRRVPTQRGDVCHVARWDADQARSALSSNRRRGSRGGPCRRLYRCLWESASGKQKR